MITFASQALETKHYSSKCSRSYVCATTLCLAAVVVPVLVLYSIGNAWVEFKEIVVQPVVQVIGHQAYCVDGSNIPYYFSSLAQEATLTNGSMSMASGTSSDGKIDVLLIPSRQGLASCSITLYLNATIQDGMKSTFLGVATADIYSPNQLIASATVQTYLRVRNSKPISRSYVPNQYFMGLDGDFSVTDTSIQNSLLRMGSRNLTILSTDTTVNVQSTATATVAPYISFQLRTRKQPLLVENDLKSQIREFVRQYVYLFLPMWIAIGLAIRWLLQNRIYSTRPMRNFPLQ